jgi:hypothetical protein
MANMSYCRFRNTLQDLQDCFDTLNDGLDLDDLSHEEKKAMIELIELSQRIGEDYEHLIK